MSENTSPELKLNMAQQPPVPTQPIPSASPVMTYTTPPVASSETLSTDPPVAQGNPLFSKFKNFKSMIVGLLVIALVAGSGYWVYANYFMSPEKMLLESLEKMDVESIKLGLSAKAEDMTVTGTVLAHETGFSKMDFAIGLAEEGMWHNFDLNFIADLENVYFKMNYTYMEMLLDQADLFVPGISSTRTFGLLKPVLTGQSWLHMMIPAEDQTAVDPDEYTEEYKQFGEKLADALVIKDFQRKTEYQGEKYSIISLGLDKEKFLEAIDSLKDLDINTEISDINNFKQAVEEMGELKETLAVVYVDLDGYIRIIDLYAPQGSSESIQDVIETEAQAKSPIMAQLSQVTALFQPDKGAKAGEAVKFMTLTFDDYGSAAQVAVPSPTVEWDEVLLYSQSELAPIFYQYMMMQQAPQQGMMNQNSNPGAVEVPTYPAQTYPAGSMPGEVIPGGAAPMNFMQLLGQ